MASREPKLAAYSEQKFKSLGYEAVHHPAGYVYFKKTCDGDAFTSEERDTKTNVHYAPTLLADNVDGCDIDYCTNDEEDHNDVDSMLHLSSTPFTEDIESSVLQALNCCFCQKTNSSRVEQVEHMRECGGTGEILSVGTVNSIVRIAKDANPSTIIQRPPCAKTSEYHRRKTFDFKRYRGIWNNKINTDKYIHCLYKNCFFMAMSVEDMCCHIGECLSDPSYAPYRCPECGGGVTSPEILHIHIQRSHPSLLNDHDHGTERLEYQIADSGHWNDGSNDSLPVVDYVQVKATANFSDVTNTFNESTEVGKSRVLNRTNEDSSDSVRESSIISESTVPSEARQGIAIEEENNSRGSLLNTCRTKGRNSKAMSASAVTHSISKKKGRSRKSVRSKDSQEETVAHSELSYISINDASASMDSSVQDLTLPEIESQTTAGSESSTLSRSRRKRTLKVLSYNDDDDDDDFPVAVKVEMVDHTNDEDFTRSRVKPQRKRRKQQSKSVPEVSKEPTSCGKCGESFNDGSSYSKHNFKVHNGLGWEVGEQPPDLANEPVILARLRDSFRESKIFRCESCYNVKKSVHGFYTHLQLCGKTEEEKERMKVSCQICGKSMKAYSLPIHMRHLHQTSVITATISDSDGEGNQGAKRKNGGKRKSAMKCVSKLKQFNDEEKTYVLFKKGSAIPALAHLMPEKWTREISRYKKATCMRDDCQCESPSVSFATLHFFNCPTVPETYYQCVFCKFYCIEESDAKHHASKHLTEEGEEGEYAADTDIDENEDGEDEGVNGYDGSQVFVKIEEPDVEDIADEYAMDSDDNVDPQNLSQSSAQMKSKKGTRPEEVKEESKAEHSYRKSWSTQVNLSAQSGNNIYRLAFEKEYTRQIEENLATDEYPTLHTAARDWHLLRIKDQRKYLPPLTKSLPLQFQISQQLSDLHQLDVFDGADNDGAWSVFVGGPVLSLAWCVVNIRRVLTDGPQILAVSVSRLVNDFLKFSDKGQWPSLVQIWDMGLLPSKSNKKPQMIVGLATDYGEALSLTWAPTDTYTPQNNDHAPRLGLLAGAFEDGVARIFSICDPKFFSDNQTRLPVYKIKPAVELVRHGVSDNDPCLRISWGFNGMVVAGYKSGTVATWNLLQLSTKSSSPGDTTCLLAIRTFKPYNNPVSALAVCPFNSNLVLSAAKDRFVTFWSISEPVEPYRVIQAALVDRIVWSKNWPALVFASEDSVLTFESSMDLRWRKQHIGCVANIRDFSFNDWTFVVCFVNDAGEVLIRHWKDPFIEVNKAKTKDNLMLSQLEVRKGEGLGHLEDYESYKEAQEDGAKLVFTEFSHQDWESHKLPKYAPAPCTAAFPLRSINQVTFNPNYRHLDHLALGYQCGLLRLMRLRQNPLELQDLFDKYDKAFCDTQN